MQRSEAAALVVEGSVEEFLPVLGLAFVLDDASNSWGVTRSTPGGLFDALEPGRRIRMWVQSHPKFSLVRQYEVLS